MKSHIRESISLTVVKTLIIVSMCQRLEGAYLKKLRKHIRAVTASLQHEQEPHRYQNLPIQLLSGPLFPEGETPTKHTHPPNKTPITSHSLTF